MGAGCPRSRLSLAPWGCTARGRADGTRARFPLLPGAEQGGKLSCVAQQQPQLKGTATAQVPLAPTPPLQMAEKTNQCLPSGREAQGGCQAQGLGQRRVPAGLRALPRLQSTRLGLSPIRGSARLWPRGVRTRTRTSPAVPQSSLGKRDPQLHTAVTPASFKGSAFESMENKKKKLKKIIKKNPPPPSNNGPVNYD